MCRAPCLPTASKISPDFLLLNSPGQESALGQKRILFGNDESGARQLIYGRRQTMADGQSRGFTDQRVAITRNFCVIPIPEA